MNMRIVFRKLLYYFVLFFAVFFITEVIAFIGIKFIKTDVFNVHGITERTYDERFITLKKNLNFKKLGPDYEVHGHPDWSIITSNYRTRISEKEINLNKFEDESIPKILFLGDSLPFGWGIDAEFTIPYLFGEKNINYFSINGGVPSYTLSQTAERFKKEFKEIKNIKYVYIQVYNVTQYGSLGTLWKETDNWFNQRAINIPLRSNKWLENSLKIKIPFYGRPQLFILSEKLLLLSRNKELHFNYPSIKSDEKYVLHIESKLREILEQVNSINAKLIIATPANINYNNEHDNEIAYYHHRALKMFIETLKKFAKDNDTYYFDVMKLLTTGESIDKNFIDTIHLSKIGSDKIASALSKLLDSK